jgi:hypothetical protein
MKNGPPVIRGPAFNILIGNGYSTGTPLWKHRILSVYTGSIR